MRRSRLALKTEKKSKQTIILAGIGILIILFLLVKFGTSVLIGFSVFLGGTKAQTVDTNSNSSVTFIPAPVLNPLPNATNSAQVVVTGKAQAGKTVYLYINSSQQDSTQSDSNGNFKFVEALSAGSNNVEAKTVDGSKTSDFSNSYTVNYISKAPSLTVLTPSDGQSFSKDQNTATVTGTTDPGVSVTVNGYWAVLDENNNFSYTLPLQNGDNQIKVIATDQAGNKTEKDLKVTYSQ